MSAPEVYTQAGKPVVISAHRRRKFLALLRDDPTLGNTAALRKAGVKGTRGQLREALDDELREQALEARGWSVQSAKNALYQVAVDTTHPHWERANGRFLRAFGGERFRDNAQLEVTGGVEVTQSDVSDAIDRFTDAVVQLAARAGSEQPALESGRPREGTPGLRVAPVERSSEPGRAAG